MKKINAGIFFAVLIISAFAIALLYNKLEVRAYFGIDRIREKPVDVFLFIVGIVFCIAAVYSVSSGFRKKFPILPFDKNILSSTYMSIQRGLLAGILGSIGALFLDNTISRIVSLILDFVYSHK